MSCQSAAVQRRIRSQIQRTLESFRHCIHNGCCFSKSMSARVRRMKMMGCACRQRVGRKLTFKESQQIRSSYRQLATNPSINDLMSRAESIYDVARFRQ